MPEKRIIEINKVYGRLPNTMDNLKKSKDIFLGSNEVHKIYYCKNSNKDLDVVYNKLPYTLNKIKTIKVGSEGGDPTKYIKPGDIESFKVDKIDGKLEVNVTSPDNIPPNTTKDLKTGTCRIIQNTSNLEVMCDYVQEGNISSIIYETPVLVNLICPKVKADGTCSSYISCRYKQLKIIKNTYTEEIKKIELDKTVEIETASGNSIIPNSGISINKPFGPHLKNNVTTERIIFNITKISIKDEIGKIYTFNNLSYNINQEANQKIEKWSDYRIFITSEKMELPVTGGSFKILVNSSATITPQYTSGTIDTSNSYKGKPICNISTSFGTLSKSEIIGVDSLDLIVNENTETKNIPIKITGSCNNGKTSNILNLQQLGIVKVIRTSWKDPIINSILYDIIPANGLDTSGIIVNYSQTKVLVYSDNSTEEIPLSGVSKAINMSGNDIVNGMNVHIDSLLVVGKYLGKEESPERNVFNGTSLTFEGLDKNQYTIPKQFILKQEENKKTRELSGYKLSLKIDPTENYNPNINIPSSGKKLKLILNSFCNYVFKWTSGYEEMVNNNSIESIINVVSNNSSKVIPNKASGTAILDLIIPENSDKINNNNITVTAYLNNLSESLKFTQDKLTETISYSSPIVTKLSYDKVNANGTGSIVSVSLKYSKTITDTNGKVLHDIINEDFIATDIKFKKILVNGSGFDIKNKKLYGPNLKDIQTSEQNISLISTVTVDTKIIGLNTDNLNVEDKNYYVIQRENSSKNIGTHGEISVNIEKDTVDFNGGTSYVYIICDEVTLFVWSSNYKSVKRIPKECTLQLDSNIDLENVTIGKLKLLPNERSTLLSIGKNNYPSERIITVTGFFNKNTVSNDKIIQTKADYIFEVVSSTPKVPKDGGNATIIYDSTKNKEIVLLTTKNFEANNRAIIKSINTSGGTKPTDQTVLLNISPNPSDDNREIIVKATQPESEKKLETIIVQLGKKIIDHIIYSIPDIISINSPIIEANGECFDKLLVKYRQKKTIYYKDGTNEVIDLGIKQANVVSVDDGKSLYPDISKVSVSNGKVIGTNLLKNETKERIVFTGTTISIISEHNNIKYINIKKQVRISQKANIKTENPKYSIDISSDKEYNRVSGDGEIIYLYVIGTKTSSLSWTSGSRENSDFARPMKCRLSTNIGTLNDPIADGDGGVINKNYINIPKNDNNSDRTITITAYIDEHPETKGYLKLIQYGKLEVDRIIFGDPFNITVPNIYFTAGGKIANKEINSKKGLVVSFNRKKITTYTNGMPDLIEVVTEYGRLKSFTGTDIYHLNVLFNNYTGSCNSLGNIIMKERLIMNGNSVTFDITNYHKSIYTSNKVSFNVYQKENKILTDIVTEYGILMSANYLEVPFNTKTVEIHPLGWKGCRRSFSSELVENYTKFIRCSISTNMGSLSKSETSGNSTEDFSILNMGENQNFEAKKFIVTGVLKDKKDYSNSVTITQGANSNHVEWGNPIIKNIEYDYIEANGGNKPILVYFEQNCRQRGNGSEIINVVHKGTSKVLNINIQKDSEYSTPGFRDGMLYASNLENNLHNNDFQIGTIKNISITDLNKKTYNSNDLGNTYKIFQKKNIKNTIDKSFSIHVNPLTESELTIGSKGSTVPITITGKKLVENIWSSGYKDPDTTEYINVGLRTDDGFGYTVSDCSFRPISIIDCNNKTTNLTIGPNLKTTDRLIKAIIWLQESPENKEIITFNQLGKKVVSTDYEIPILVKTEYTSTIPANGKNGKSIIVEYNQTKVINYDSGKPDKEILRGFSTITKTNKGILNRNFTISSNGTLSCDSRGTTLVETRTIVYKTNEITIKSRFNGKEYTLLCNIEVTQDPNTWKDFNEDSAIYNLKLTPKNSHVGTLGGPVEIKADGFGKGDVIWSSGERSYETFYPDVRIIGPGLDTVITSNGGVATVIIPSKNMHWEYNIEGTMTGGYKASCRIIQN